MVRKRKCRACGFKFKLERENRYLVKRLPYPFGNLSEKPTIFEVFDCPQCGCQNPLGTYMPPIEEEKKG